MRITRKAAPRVAVAVPVAAALAMWGASPAHAIDSTGGTVGPVAVLATRGTGGTVYVAAQPKPRAPRKPHARKPARKSAPTRKPAPAPPAPTGGETPVFPVVGPHSFGDSANRFGAGRTGHIHQGQDVLAGEGQQVVAPLAGTIITTGFQASAAGWYVAEHTPTTFDFFFAHCQAGSLSVSTGQSVRAGQALCKVGQTGDATGPHLHFEMWVGGWQAAGGHPVDPLPYLEAWDRAAGG
jgi:murein DD-endopeptidase MepM/ murein hydrolase activator NlpD